MGESVNGRSAGLVVVVVVLVVEVYVMLREAQCEESAGGACGLGLN
eukprot:gene14167-biopygen16770